MSRRIQRVLTGRYVRLGERLGRWTTPAWLAIVVVLLIVAASTVGFAVVGLATDSPGGFDLATTEWVVPRRTAGLTQAVQVVTGIGDTISLVILGTGIGLAWRWRRGDWAGLAVLVGAYLGATSVYSAVKPIVGRVRPPAELAVQQVPDLSFPSGHTMGAAAVYVTLAFLVVMMRPRGWSRTAILGGIGVLVVLIAASRVYLGVHWTTDVVVGLVAGVTWGFAVMTPVWANRAADEAPTRAR